MKYQGLRYHMSNIMAAIGREQLKKVNSIKTVRLQIAKEYLTRLKDIEYIEFLKLDYENIIPHIFVVKVKNNRRDKLREYLADNNIECGIYYLPNHTLPKYRTIYNLPVAETAYGEILSLPIHLDLDGNQQEFVVSKIKEFFN